MSAIAIFSYTATQSDELSITKDEVLTVLDSETTDEGWTCVVGKNGGKGIVPEGYLKLLPATSSESNPKQNIEVTNNNNNVITANQDEPDDINSHYIAKFSYESTDDDELNLSPGDKLKLLSPPQADGWTHALKISDNTSGMVPLNYIEKDEHYIDHTKDAGNELTDILQRRTASVPTITKTPTVTKTWSQQNIKIKETSLKTWLTNRKLSTASADIIISNLGIESKEDLAELEDVDIEEVITSNKLGNKLQNRRLRKAYQEIKYPGESFGSPAPSRSSSVKSRSSSLTGVLGETKDSDNDLFLLI